MNCRDCKYYFYDDDTGYCECTKTDDFTDEEYAEYEQTDEMIVCSHFEEDVR